MKIIVGLGNPGEKYSGTRHNAGFMFLDKMICHPAIAPVGECVKFEEKPKFEAEIAQVSHKGEKLILVKPQTFMNLSGQAVSKIKNYYQADFSDLIVVSDDKDLPLGNIRVRLDGSGGGQRGLENVITALGQGSFVRVRIGIGPIAGDKDNREGVGYKLETTEFVLSNFSDREKKLVDRVLDEAIEYILPFLGGREPIPAHTITLTFDSL